LAGYDKTLLNAGKLAFQWMLNAVACPSSPDVRLAVILTAGDFGPGRRAAQFFQLFGSRIVDVAGLPYCLPMAFSPARGLLACVGSAPIYPIEAASR
jgi:hypothetical protein